MPKLSVPVGKQDHIQGSDSAACTLVEYGDYQCPSCREAFAHVHRVQKHFGDKLRFVFRNFPLEQHEFAEPAAETAEFAASQGKFWEMHDALYREQPKLSDAFLGELAARLALDTKALETALEQGTFAGRVETDLESGEKSGVEGTPTFYVNGQQHSGAYDAASLIEAIDAAMGG